MKITRNNLRGTSVLSFDLNDTALDEWLEEAKKPGVGLYEAGERVLKQRGGKVKVRNSPCECEDEDD